LERGDGAHNVRAVFPRTCGNIDLNPMGGKYMSEEIKHDRRRFLGTAVMTIAAAELVMIGSADAQSSRINLADATTIKPGTNTSFGSLKQINAGVNQTSSSPVQKLSRAVQRRTTSTSWAAVTAYRS